ncbi:hypothetical protein D8770_14990 [Methylobacterium sp. DB1607]|nr:hypothetical protein [Methylobacterium sp. DB1607]
MCQRNTIDASRFTLDFSSRIQQNLISFPTQLSTVLAGVGSAQAFTTALNGVPGASWYAAWKAFGAATAAQIAGSAPNQRKLEITTVDVLTILANVGIGVAVANPFVGIALGIIASATIASLGEAIGNSANYNTSNFDCDKKFPTSRPNLHDPLVLDLDNDGVSFSNINKSNIHFDFDGDGFAEKSGWVSSNDGLLALDINNNGQIDNGSELFGSAVEDGFISLSKYDSNKDGVIDGSDAIFDRLLVWTDKNQNGVSDDGELTSLSALGIESISLNTDFDGSILEGNYIVNRGKFSYVNGDEHEIVSVNFTIDKTISKWIAPDGYELPEHLLKEPNISGYGRLKDLRYAMADNSELFLIVKNFKTSLANMNGETALSAFNEVLFEWAGVNDVDPSSNGVLLDARMVSFLSCFYNDGTLENLGNVSYAAANSIKLNYEEVRDALLSRFAASLPDYSASFDDSVQQGITKFFSPFSMLLLRDDDKFVGDLRGAVESIYENLPSAVVEKENYISLMSALLRGASAELTTGLLENVNIISNLAVKILGSVSLDAYNIINSHFGQKVDIFHDGASKIEGDASIVVWLSGDISSAEFERPHTPGISLVLAGINQSDVLIHRSEFNLSIEIQGADGSDIISINNQLDPSLRAGVENIVFEDGTSWSKDVMRQEALYASATNGNDIIDGFSTNDTIDGKAGDDLLRGLAGNDTYIYTGAIGGNVIIRDEAYSYQNSDADRLVFTDLNPADITVSRAEDSNDLVATVAATGKTITVSDQFSTAGAGWNFVEQFQFADGTTWSINEMAIAALTAGSGDKTLFGRAGNDTYTYTGAIGGNVVIRDKAYSFQNSDADRLVFTDLNPADISLARTAGSTDLVLTVAATGKTVTIKDQFSASSYGTIEQFQFADGTAWSLKDIAGALHTAGSGDKTLVGGAFNDTYTYTGAIGGNVVILDEAHSFQNSDADRLVFTDLNPADVSVSRAEDSNDLVLTVAATGKTVTIKDQFVVNGSGWNFVEQFQFADGTTWSINEMAIAALTAGSGDKTLFGRAGNDTYTYTGAIGGNVVIHDKAYGYNNSDADRLVFTDLNPADISLARTAGSTDLVLTVAATGKTVTIKDQFSASSYGTIEQFQFADGTAWSLKDIAGALHTAGSGDKTLVGGAFNDTYTYTGAIGGNVIIRDEAYSYQNSDADRLVFTDLNPADVSVSRAEDSNDLVLTVAATGKTITVSDQFSVSSYGTIEQFQFSDGTTWLKNDLLV